MSATRDSALENALPDNNLSEALLPASNSSDDMTTLDISPSGIFSASFSNELGLNQGLRTELEAMTVMPQKLSKKHTGVIAFALGTSAAVSVLYATGGEGKGLKYEISGPAVNVIQGWGFATQAFAFLKQQAEGTENNKLVIGLTLLGSFLATAVPTIAAYQLPKEVYLKYIEPPLTFVGVLPCNIYGVASTIDRIRNYRTENPRVRSFISNNYRLSLPESDRSQLEDSQSTFTKILAYILGTTLLVPMTTSQTGSVCSSSAFAENDLRAGNVLGTIIGLIANFPMIAIGVIASYDLANEATNLMANAARVLTNRTTRGDKVQLASSLILGAIFSYCAYYSSATSERLYEENCDFTGFIDTFLRENVEKGTMAFNEVLTLKAIFTFSKLAKEAYDSNPESQAIYKIRATDENIRHNLPTKELEKLAAKHYPDKKLEWENKPSAAALLARTSPVTSASRATTVPELADQDEAEQLRPNACDKIMRHLRLR